MKEPIRELRCHYLVTCVYNNWLCISTSCCNIISFVSFVFTTSSKSLSLVTARYEKTSFLLFYVKSSHCLIVYFAMTFISLRQLE